MGKAVNYNDIVEIIKSDIEFIDDIVDVINSSIEEQSKTLNPALVDVLTSNINLVGVIINQINDFYGKVDFKNVDNFLSFLKTSTEKFSEMSKLQGPVDYDAIIKCIQNLSKVFSHILELQNIDINKLDKDIKSYVGVVDSIISITEGLITLSKLSGRVDRNAIVKYIQGLSKIINSISEIPRVKFKDIIGLMLIVITMRFINLIAIDLLLHLPLYSMSMISIKQLGVMVRGLISAMHTIEKFLHTSVKLYFTLMMFRTTINPGLFINITNYVRTKLVPAIRSLLVNLLKMMPSMNIVKFVKFKMKLIKWVSILDHIKELLNGIKSLYMTILISSMVLNEAIIRTGLRNISILLNGINELLVSSKVSIKTLVVVWKIKLILKQFIKLIKMMAHALLSIMAAMMFITRFKVFLTELSTVLSKISKINVKVLYGVKIISKILRSLIYIAIQLILLAVISPAAIVAIVPIMLFVLALNLFIKYVKFIFSGLNHKVFKSISKGIGKISIIFSSLALIAMSIIILAVLCVPATLLLGVIGIFLVGLSILFGILYITLALTNKIANKTFILNLLKISLILFILTVIAAAVVMLGVLSIGALIMTPAIVIFLIDLVVITGLFVAVGYVAAMVSSIIGVAILGLLSVLVLIGVMVLIAGALWLLGKIVIDTDKVLENVKTILSTASTIVEDIFNNDTEDQTKKSGDKTLGDTIANMLGGMVKGILSIINLIIGIPYLLMIFIAITLILFIATALRILQIIDLKPDKISENVGIVLDTAKLIIDSIFSREQEDKTKTGGGDSTLGSWIADHLGDMVRGIISVINIIIGNIYLFMIFMAVAMILFIATTLRILQELELDKDLISKNVGTVFETADQIIMSVFNSGKEEEKQPEKKDKPWYVSLFDWVCDFGKSFLGGLGRIAGLLVSIPYLVLILTSVGLVWSIVSILNQIATFKLTSTAISTKVGDIIKVANSVIDAIFNNDIKVSKIDPRDNFKLQKVLNTIKTFTDQIQKLPKDIQGTVEIIKNLKLMRSVNHNALYLLSYIQKQDFDYNKITRSLDLLERFNEVTKDFIDVDDDDVKRSKEITDNYIKFIDKVNGVNLENLKTTERLFENMAKFSESINGNFDKLAEALNDKIAPLLEELKGLMEKVPQHIDKASADQQKTAVEVASNSVNKETYKRANFSDAHTKEVAAKNEKLNQSQYNKLSLTEKIVKILEGNNPSGGVKISKQR